MHVLTATPLSAAPPSCPTRHSQMLNALYEEAFPGLRYITFVNGRSRAEIIPELEVSSISQTPPLGSDCPPNTVPAAPAHFDQTKKPDPCGLLHLQDILGINLPPPSPNVGEPRLSATRSANGPQVKVAGSAAWRAELKRDLKAMWDIAQARLVGLGVQ